MARERTDQAQLDRLDMAPPLHERVHSQLEALIVSRAMPPGARIVEQDLAEQLGVSRGPIREALKLLARDGFVDLRPRQGTFVHVPTKKEIADFFDVRRSLEVTAAGLAAQRVTPAQAQRLRDLIDVAKGLLAEGKDPSKFRDRAGIHREIHAIADNALLTQLLTNLKRLSEWYSPPFDPVARGDAWHQHIDIVDAIAAGASGRAMAAMAKHVDNSRDHYYAAMSGEDTETAFDESIVSGLIRQQLSVTDRAR